MRRATNLVGVVLAAAAALANAQAYDPVADFCRRFSHDAAVVGERLYINDGQLNLQNRGGKNFTNDRLLFHDLTTSQPPGSDAGGMPVLDTNLSKPTDVPSLIGAALWADQANARLFQYGGQWPDNKVPEDRFQLWTYDIYNDTWATRDPDRAVDRLSFGANVAVESTGKAYQLGGWMNAASDINWSGPRKASNRMAVYDMVSDTWANTTGPTNGMGRAEGVMFYVPFGDDPGMLVHFGGIQSKDGGPEQPSPMDVIDIYDIANQNWYTQNATGAIPGTRRRFCGGAAYAQDGSSANIYIYGGLGFGANETGYDDSYILTIPSFTWIQIFPTPGIPRSESEIRPHYDLTCSVIKGAQLLIIGGQFPKDPNATNCDVADKTGVHNLVMSKVNKGTESVYWDRYDPSRDTYTLPDDILSVIGGDAQGHAQVRSPANSFDAADLALLFQRTVTPTIRAPTRAAPSSTSTSNSTSAGAFSTPAKRATILAPSIVGGVAVLSLAGFLLLRHRRRKQKKALEEGPPGYKAHDSAHPAESVTVTTPYSPLPTGGWHPPPPPPAPHQQQQYGYSARAYSESSTAQSETIRQMSISPPPLPELGTGSGWSSPEPEPRLAGGGGVVPGHYPPPLVEGMAEVRSSRGPEMKEVRGPGEGGGFGTGE